MLTIWGLAGHESLETTQRYMHLLAAAPRWGIRALEARGTTGAPQPPVAIECSSVDKQ